MLQHQAGGPAGPHLLLQVRVSGEGKAVGGQGGTMTVHMKAAVGLQLAFKVLMVVHLLGGGEPAAAEWLFEFAVTVGNPTMLCSHLLSSFVQPSLTTWFGCSYCCFRVSCGGCSWLSASVRVAPSPGHL